jgi:hypothetical protein
MAHLPVDHPLRGLYRGLAFLTGVALVVFGIAGYLKTSDMGFFQHPGMRVLGLTTNPAFSLLSLVVGAGVAIASAIGRNVDVPVNTVLGAVFMLAGLVMLCVLRTDLNFLAFSITNVNVSSVIGLILITAGLYGRESRQRGGSKVRARASVAADAH